MKSKAKWLIGLVCLVAMSAMGQTKPSAYNPSRAIMQTRLKQISDSIAALRLIVVTADDYRLVNPRIPTGGAGGALSGNFPNPGFNIPVLRGLFSTSGSGIGYDSGTGKFFLTGFQVQDPNSVSITGGNISGVVITNSTIPLSNVTGAQSALDAKQNALGFVPLNRAGNLSDIVNALAARQNLGLGTLSTQNSNLVSISGGTLGGVTITNSTIPLSNVTGAQAAIDTKQNSLGYQPLNPSNNLSELLNPVIARANLGLSALAVQPPNSVSITGGSVIGLTEASMTHLLGFGSAPALSLSVGAGSSPSAVSMTDATDLSGYINFTTGSSPTSGLIVRVIFSVAYTGSRKPKVLIDGYNDAAILNRGLFKVDNVSLSGFDIINTKTASTGNTLPANTSFIITYQTSQ